MSVNKKNDSPSHKKKIGEQKQKLTDFYFDQCNKIKNKII